MSGSRIGNLGIDTILIIVLIGLAVYGLFYILKRYIIPFQEPGKTAKKARITVFRIEVLVWGIFILYALTQLLTESIWIVAVLLAIVGLIGFNFWLDFFPGLWFRLQNRFAVNDPVRFNEFSGTIQKIGKTHIIIKSEDEELIYLSYRKIDRGTFIKRQAKGKLVSAKTSYDIAGLDRNEIGELFRQWAFECPWAIFSPQDDPVSISGDTLSVTLYAVDSASLGKIEQFLVIRFTEFQNKAENS